MPTLKTLRKRARLTQDELAVRSGLEQPTISALERGKMRDPRLSTLRKASRGLKLPLPTIIAALDRSVAGG